MTLLENAWLIAALPLLSWLIIMTFNRRLGERASYVGAAAVLLSMVLSVVAFFQLVGTEEPVARSFRWAVVGDVEIPMGFVVDSLAAVMLLVVTIVSGMVHVFSIGYMHGDPKYGRYFGNLSLFTFAMLGLVLADNFLLLLVMWEIMGLCSYLLIGHWFEQDWPRWASIKAFLTTRVGDVLMMAGIWLLFTATGSFNIAEISGLAADRILNQATITLGALLLFGGAVGKSAQFPLHVWLPDAMAGPTPVSALIHAATMVAAGVYLVARSYGIFAHSADALLVVAFIGALTAFMAATIATVMTDMKKVMAYSTVSQLGYMMLALGVGGFTAGVFHLMTHAFFKALLFLTSGSVSHAVHTFEIHQMGGLYRKMKVTFWTFVIGAGALAGIPPLSGFWSKDEILLAAYHSPYKILFWAAVLTALITAYYVTRMTFLVFFGKPRDHHRYEHAHESAPVMTVPLLVLAVLAALAGLAGSPLTGHWFGHFIYFGHPEEVAGGGIVLPLALGASVTGIFLAWLFYGARVVDRRRAIAVLRPLYTILKNKYYVDELYQVLFVRSGIKLAELAARFDLGVIDWVVNAIGYGTVKTSEAAGDFDLQVVDGAVNGVAYGVVASGRQARRIHTGYVQSYMIVLGAGALIGLAVLLWKVWV